MIILLISSLALSAFMIIWAYKRLDLNEEIREFLRNVIVWLTIALSVFLIHLLGGGGK